MASRTVVVELQIADKNATAQLGKLQVETRQYQQSLKLLNSIVDENGRATVRQQQQIGELTAKIENNRVQIREMKNDLSGATAAGLRFRDKMAEASIEAIRQSGVLGKLDAQYAALTGELAKGTATISANEIALKELRAEYQKGEFTAAEYKAQVAALKNENAQVAASNQKLEENLKGVGAQITSLDKKVEDLTADFKAGKITAEEFKRGIGTINSEVARQGGLITNGINDLRSYALGFVGVIAAAQGIARITKELFELSGEIEKTDARNRAIAGDSLPQFEAAAEATANAIGLTRREYVSLAADQALRLKQLGLEGDLVTDLSTQTVEFSEKLSDFSAGELTTEQAAALLNDALTGQTKGLKALGINVKASKDEIAAQAQELMRSKGLTEEQATAVATLQLAFDATTESMAAFGAETLSIDEAQDNATAQLNEAKEALADSFTPVVIAATKAWAVFLDGLAGLGTSGSEQASLNNFTARTQVELEKLGIHLALVAEEGDSVTTSLRNIADAAHQIGEENIGGVFDIGLLKMRGEEAIAILGDVIRERVKLEGRVGFSKERDAADLQANKVREAAARAAIAAVQEEIQKRGELFTAQKKSVELDVDKIQTLNSLRAKLKSLKDAREDLDVTDTEGLKTNEAAIAALEKQIAALEVSTKATQGKTKAVQELTAAQKAQNELDLAAASIQGTGKDALFKPQQDVGPDNTLGDAEIEKRTIVNEALADKYKEDVKNYNNAQDEKRMSENEALAATANIAGSLATLFDEQSVEYKAFATIQALISTYLGAAMALTDETIPSTFARIAAAAVVVFNGLANVRRIQGFEEGGHTKKRASNHDEVGVVHANEWVAPAWQVKHPTYAPIIASLEKARKSRGMRSDRVGFYTGGTVTRGTALVNSPTAPRTTSATIATADMNRLLSSIDFQPVVRVTDINKGQKTVRVTDRMSTL